MRASKLLLGVKSFSALRDISESFLIASILSEFPIFALCMAVCSVLMKPSIHCKQPYKGQKLEIQIKWMLSGNFLKYPAMLKKILHPTIILKPSFKKNATNP